MNRSLRHLDLASSCRAGKTRSKPQTEGSGPPCGVDDEAERTNEDSISSLSKYMVFRLGYIFATIPASFVILVSPLHILRKEIALNTGGHADGI